MKRLVAVAMGLLVSHTAMAVDSSATNGTASSEANALYKLVQQHDEASERAWWNRLRDLYARHPAEVMAALAGASAPPSLLADVPAPKQAVSETPQISRATVAADEASVGAPPVPSDFVAKALVQAADANAAPATADRHARGLSSAVQLDASAGGTMGTISWSLPATAYLTSDKKQIRSAQWAITATTAVDNKSEGSATFANLDGVANGASVGFDFTFTNAGLAAQSVPAAQAQLCLLSGHESPWDCKGGTDFDALGPKSEADRAEYARLLADWHGLPETSQVYNLHGSVTHNGFTYYDAPSTKHTADKTGWKFGGEVGMTTHSMKTYYGVGFDLVHGYKEDKDTIVCPASSAPSYACINGKFSAPKSQVGRQLYAETRSWLAGWAYSVRLMHDFATHDDAIDVPIYLFGSKDAVFTGGVRVGWTTDDHLLAGVFVGKPFNLYKTSQ